MDKLHEECAVFGVSCHSGEAAGTTYNGLLALQHRGQEGAGIAALCENRLLCCKNVGLVGEVFDDSVLQKLSPSSMAVGHTRYSTTGSNLPDNVQPFVTEFLTGRIATAHNGNITNAVELKRFLSGYGVQFTATSDSEIVSSLIAFEAMNQGDIVAGITAAVKQLKGAFSLVILSSENKLIAVRDPNGFRPLCIGESDHGTVVASESCALESCGYRFVRDVEPGEMIVIENGAVTRTARVGEEKTKSLCIFEYVYFARPDSVIDGRSVYEARFDMGRHLAREHSVEADVVCGVPDSGLEAAMGYAAESGIPLVSGFVKNRYIGRTVSAPSQEIREKNVNIKLNAISNVVRGRRVVLIDDSIVRGTTSARIIRALRNAGATQVHMRISAPPFLHTCHFGTDIDSEENLIANNMTIDEICRKIGADSLGFISIDGLRQSCAGCRLNFCTGCFDGNYGSEENCRITTAKAELEGGKA